MHRYLKPRLLYSLHTKSANNKCSNFRYASTTTSDTLFPETVDFPSRHIGPRDQDVVTMLDLLGYKVG